ncbi:MAG TPA: UDP-N-acetylglucosamine diphosphorylase [Spirochaetia bacterium]|nr:UDP-N-acetylglucosamine diphosphorylase [Spirochaetia bacterium]
MLETSDLLDLPGFGHRALFDRARYAWDALPALAVYIRLRMKPENRGRVIGSAFVGDNVMIGEGTVIEPGAVIKGPAIIGRNCEIRSGAYVRENVIVGDGCVLGNSCEFKNAVLFDGVQVPHFSYVGDSILGFKSHLGAGVILSNVKSDGGAVTVRTEPPIHTGLVKFGAIVGDQVEVGCNCVLSPGSIIGRRVVLYPNLLWRGVCPPDSIVKLQQSQQITTRRNSLTA